MDAELLRFLDELEPVELAQDWLAVVGNELRPAFDTAGVPFPPALDDAMHAAARRAGATAADTDAQIVDKVSRYLRERPFPPAWASTFASLARDAAGTAAATSAQTLQALGLAVSARSALTAKPVAGATQMGALGRFSLTVPPKR